MSLSGFFDHCCILSKIVVSPAVYCDHEGWRLLTCRNWGVTERLDLGGRKVILDCWVYRLGTGFIYGVCCDSILLPGRAEAVWYHRHRLLWQMWRGFGGHSLGLMLELKGLKVCNN